MFYLFQMNDGRWHVDAFTSAPRSAHAIAAAITGSETRSEAEDKRRAAAIQWAEMRT